MADLFTAHGVDPAIRLAVIAELRAQAAAFAVAGRNAIPGGVCGTVTSLYNGVIDGPKPTSLYDEARTLEIVAAVFKHMLDAAEGIELYQPRNGEEGRAFMAKWCEQCAKDDGEHVLCPIVADTMVLDVDDDDYPREWRCDGPKGPRCTAFEARKEGAA